MDIEHKRIEFKTLVKTFDCNEENFELLYLVNLMNYVKNFLVWIQKSL